MREGGCKEEDKLCTEVQKQGSIRTQFKNSLKPPGGKEDSRRIFKESTLHT